MSLIYIGGVNGVGKTSVAEEFARRSGVQMLNGSTELMKCLGILGDYDKLRKLPESVKSEALEALFHDLALVHRGVPVVVAGHYVKILYGEVSPSYGSWYRHCAALVLVTSPPDSILQRILGDEASGARTGRDLFGPHDTSPEAQTRLLERAQRMSLEVVHRATREFGVPSFFLENEEGRLFDATEKLANVVWRRS